MEKHAIRGVAYRSHNAGSPTHRRPDGQDHGTCHSLLPAHDRYVARVALMRIRAAPWQHCLDPPSRDRPGFEFRLGRRESDFDDLDHSGMVPGGESQQPQFGPPEAHREIRVDAGSGYET